jgi:hypothetical protein
LEPKANPEPGKADDDVDADDEVVGATASTIGSVVEEEAANEKSTLGAAFSFDVDDSFSPARSLEEPPCEPPPPPPPPPPSPEDEVVRFLKDKLGGGAENPGNEEDEAKAAEVALVVALAPITEDCCCCGRDVPDGLVLFTLKDSLAPFGVFPFMLLLPLLPNPNAVPGAIADAVRDGNDPSDVAAAAICVVDDDF